jgi:nitrous oxidase accessory protein NosD
MYRMLMVAFALIVTAGSLMWAAPAHAQATRTWVSGVGDDTNPCSRTAPCKTFAGAISKTATGGQINCLDPGGFGAVTITKAITITCANTQASVLVTGTNGIVVNTTNVGDVVVLDGLDIEGLGTGINGIRILKGSVFIRNCRIRNFLSAAPNGNAVLLFGPASTRAFISNSTLTNNRNGVDVLGNGAGNSAVLEDVLLDKNAGFSVSVSAASTVILNRTTMIGSANSIIAAAGAQVISYGTNLIRNGGTPTQTLVLQ